MWVGSRSSRRKFRKLVHRISKRTYVETRCVETHVKLELIVRRCETLKQRTRIKTWSLHCPSLCLSFCLVSVRPSVLPSVCLSVSMSVCLSACPPLAYSVSILILDISNFSTKCTIISVAFLQINPRWNNLLSVWLSVCFNVSLLVSFRLSSQLARDEFRTQRNLLLPWHDVLFDAWNIHLQQMPSCGLADSHPCRESDKTRDDNSLRKSHKELD